jgi:hypothetical protein
MVFSALDSIDCDRSPIAMMRRSIVRRKVGCHRVVVEGQGARLKILLDENSSKAGLRVAQPFRTI